MIRLIKSLIKSIGKAFSHDPEVQRILDKYPRFKKFMKRRLTRGERFGLSLTIGVLIASYLGFLFFGIIQDYIGKESVINIDLRLLNLVQVLREPILNKIMLFITYLGGWQVIVAGVVLVSIFMIMRKRWYYLFTLLFSVGFGEAFVWLTKILIARPRPPLVNALAPETSYSFPSGHTFVAIAFYGLIAYYLFIYARSRLMKALIIVGTVVLIGAVGFSRIYLGAHWPSDVFSSFAAAGALVVALITALETHRKYGKGRRFKDKERSGRTIQIGLALLVLWFTFVAIFYVTHPLKRIEATSEPSIKISTENLPEVIFQKFPRTSEDLSGNPMEPIDLVFVGTDQELENAFLSAGWERADRIGFNSGIRSIYDSIFKLPYPTAPGTPSFWDAVPNNFGYEKSTLKNIINEREHIHFWQTPFMVGQKSVWVATAHFDKAVSFAIKGHVIDPAIDKERENVKNELEKTGLTALIKEFQIVEPTLGSNSVGSTFFTDGKAYLIFL